jgi:DNA repair protein RecO (recombination protein O)
LARCTFHFELAALALLGHLPSLAECVECGEKVKGERRVWFGHLAGGALCAKCRPGQRKVVSVSVDAIEAMKRLAELDDEAWIDWPINAKVRGEIRGVLNHYLAHLAGRPMKMLRYLSV